MGALKSRPLALALLLWAGLSCDRVTAPPTTGGIRIRLVSEQGAGLTAVPADQNGASFALYPIDAPTLSVLLDSMRVTVTGGGVNQTASATTATPGTSNFNVTISGLAPNTYTVTVVGYSGGQVAHYGQTTVSVTAGQDTDAVVTFPVFQPVVPNPTAVDTVEVLRFTVSWPTVTNATSYVVEVSASPTLATVTTTAAASTTQEVTVSGEGQYYYAVRAVNASAPNGGIRSAIKSVAVFQTVGSVNVLPATPSIVDGTTQQFNATARDLDNNVVSNVTLFWASSNHSVATVSPSGLVTSIGPGQTTITAIAKGTPGNAALTVTPQAASQLVFTTPPTTTTAGQSIADIKVAIRNAKNQTLTSDNSTQVTLQVAANPGSGALSGTATATVQQGVATFTGLNINKSGVGYTLQATATSLTSATSGQFNITAGVATNLAFSASPGTTTAGQPIAPAVQVEVRDANGNRVTTARDQITLGFQTNPAGGAISGTKIVNATDGIASFSGLSIDKSSSGYALSASAAGLAAGQSATFTINPGPAVALAFSSQPTNTVTDNDISVAVAIVDQFGNTVNTSNAVTVSIGTNAGGGTLTGTTTQSASGGTASFTNLHIDKVGTGYTLTAQSGLFTAATSNPFNMTVGVPAKLAFVSLPEAVEPSEPMNFDVAVQDAGGNQTTAAVNVTIAIGTNAGGGILNGILTSASSNGVASFTNITIDSGGAPGYTLDATGGGLATAQSFPFDVVLDFASVQTGDTHSCGLTTTGSAYCWGWNPVSGIGDGTSGNSRFIPTRVSGANQYFAITTGWVHTCALRTSDSTAFCWGFNQDGQAGIGSIGPGTGVLTPTAVVGGHKFIAISAGNIHTCAIRAVDSLAFCWGERRYGRLGGGDTTTADVTSPTQVNSADRFASISAGFEHTCAVRNDSVGFCWGRQGNGRLGNGQIIAGQVGSPTAVTGAATTFLSISAGNNHTCGVSAPDSDRRGFCWGAFGNGQLGFTSAVDVGTSTVVAGSLKYSSIQAGGRTNFFSCGVTTGGTPFCWGSAIEGRLGNGVNVGNFDSPQAVLSPLQFLSIDVSTSGGSIGGHACGLTTGGVYCWGLNFSGANGGALGDGTIASSSVPVKVKGQR